MNMQKYFLFVFRNFKIYLFTGWKYSVMIANNSPKVNKQFSFFQFLWEAQNDQWWYPNISPTWPNNFEKVNFENFWTICKHNISCLIITCVILWYDMIWYHIIWYEDMMWWYAMMWSNDMIRWYDNVTWWYDMIRC